MALKLPIRRTILKIWAAVFLLALSGAGVSTLMTSALSSTRDCSDNSVIRCGALSISELKQKYNQNQAGNVQALYKLFGISGTADFDGMVVGHVDNTNKVFVDASSTPKLVATNAITAGRQNMTNSHGSSTPVLNGQFFERPPSVSFASSSLDAFIKLDSNGKFMFAVLTSCGNPVRGTPVTPPAPKPQPQPQPQPQPTPVPSFTIQKQVRAAGQNDWQAAVTTAPGTQVQYRIVVTNTGQTDFASVHVSDSLPGGLTMVTGSLTSATAQTNQASTTTLAATTASTMTGDITQGIDTGPLKQGNQVTLQFSATADSSNSGNGSACTEGLTNTATAQPPNLPSQSDTAIVHICAAGSTPPAPISITPATATPVAASQPAPQSLPNTGPGTTQAIAGLFIGTSLAGAALHRFAWLLRGYFQSRL